MMDTGQAILSLLVVLAVIAFIALYVGLICVVGDKAGSLGRSVFYWVVLSLLISPIIALPLLHCAGETDKRRLQRIGEEEYYGARNRMKASIVETHQVQNQERYMPK